ncbi:MAG: acetolactate synthase small subunit [Spirochaetes bacterium]|nr:acetolactate synthase small subunit [Spirochaetota bacterium]
MNNRALLKIDVRNHPGVMSHVTGLFSRRAYNMEAIACAPIDETLSRMYILVAHDGRLTQIVKQIKKLVDVRSVTVADDAGDTVYERIHRVFDEV